MPRAAACRCTCASPAGPTGATLTVNGEPRPSRRAPGTYTRVEREWAAGDDGRADPADAGARSCAATAWPRRSRTRSPSPAARSSTASRAPTCPRASRSSRRRCAAAPSSAPVEIEIDGQRAGRARGRARSCCPPADDEGLYADVEDAAACAASGCGSSPTSRGATADPARCRSGSPWSGDTMTETATPHGCAAHPSPHDAARRRDVRHRDLAPPAHGGGGARRRAVDRHVRARRARVRRPARPVRRPGRVASRSCRSPARRRCPAPSATRRSAAARSRVACGSRSTTSARRCRTCWPRSPGTSSRSRSSRRSSSSTSSCRARSPSATPGRRSALEGTRRLMSRPDGAMIGTIVKPSIGLSPDELAEVVGELAAAGIDFIKDDELQGNGPVGAARGAGARGDAGARAARRPHRRRSRCTRSTSPTTSVASRRTTTSSSRPAARA